VDEERKRMMDGWMMRNFTMSSARTHAPMQVFCSDAL